MNDVVFTIRINVCLYHDCELCKNGWTDQDVVCMGRGPMAQGTTY